MSAIFSTRVAELGTEDQTVQLLVSGDRWRHRSVSKLSILDQQTVRWRVSVDFTIPPLADGMRSLYVPLVLAPKRKLSGIDIIDENGRRLPAVTREHEVQLTLQILLNLWQEYTNSSLELEYLSLRVNTESGAPAIMTSSVVGLLSDLIRSGPKKSVERFAWIRDSGLLDRIGDERRREYFAQTLKLFTHSGVIYTIIDNAISRDRRILKLVFVDRLPSRRRSSHETGRQRWRRRIEATLQSLGIRSTPLIWWIPAWQGVASYHVEAEAPDALVYIDSLLAEEPGDANSPLAGAWSARFHIARLDSGLPSSKRVHLYRRDPRNKDGRLLHALYLRPPPSGWLVTAVLASFTVAVALTLIACDIRHLYSTDRATTVASAVLTLGAIVVVLIARPLEHNLTARLLLGKRAALLLSAASALVAIAFLLRLQTPAVFNTHEPLSHAVGVFAWVRWICVFAAWLAFSVIFASLLSWQYSTSRLRRILDVAEAEAQDGFAP